jgi:2-polyprenyl-6-methoxyphenol hydroxylase-like FAD-dependent oxidoreductase
MDAADVIVVGGGFTGSTLAAALAGGGRRILVLEARPGRNPRFAGELIHPTGVDVLDQVGVLSALEGSGGQRARGFAVVRAPGEPTTLLPYAEIPGARPWGFAMDHHDMVRELRGQATARPGVTLRTGARVVDALREGGRVVGVKLDDGEELRAPLTLAAEGRHSKLRPILGIDEQSQLLSFSAAVLARDTELPHPGYGHIFLGAWGPILAYQIGARDVRMVLDVPSPEDGGEKGLPQVAARLRAEYAPLVPEPLRGSMVRALEAGELQLAANYAISTRRCAAPGTALVGESGGCSHPLTATGMTVCLNDIQILVDELRGVSDPRAIDQVLQRYQTRRYRFVRAREILADALYEVFRGAEDSTRAIRHGIFRYWESSGRARAASMALLSGHESRLASFLGEYWRVVLRSTGGVVRGQVNEPSLAGRARSLQGLAAKAWEKLGKVAEGVREGSLR